MYEISAAFIQRCSLTMGQLDCETVNLLFRCFRDQESCASLNRLSTNLREKFENLLSNSQENNNDTPLTRIEVAVLMIFKQTFLNNVDEEHGTNPPRRNRPLSIEDQLKIAYCFLLAQVDDRLNSEHIRNLKFLLKIRTPMNSLFEIYLALGETFGKFFDSLLQCNYLESKVVLVDRLIRDAQLFIQRYEDFLVSFKPLYQSMSSDTILSENDAVQTDLLTSQWPLLNRDQIKAPTAPVNETTRTNSVNPPISPLKTSFPLSNVPRKGLCVIINIRKFDPSQSMEISHRAGSEKDVELIKLIFNKLSFVVLECRQDFKKEQIDQALNYVNDRSVHGEFDCLVMFIMSHGLLHSFFAADGKEVIIRDIVRRFSDSSSTTIWTRKPRLFFIQACRSDWPFDLQSNQRQDVQQSDLSSQMLIAYSCSPREAAKRNPMKGSFFIQILCIMLLKYGHSIPIHNILGWTSEFISKRDEHQALKEKKIESAIQRPEFIHRNFSADFRFSSEYLFENWISSIGTQPPRVQIAFSIWNEFRSILSKSRTSSVTSSEQ